LAVAHPRGHTRRPLEQLDAAGCLSAQRRTRCTPRLISIDSASHWHTPRQGGGLTGVAAPGWQLRDAPPRRLTPATHDRPADAAAPTPRFPSVLACFFQYTATHTNAHTRIAPIRTTGVSAQGRRHVGVTSRPSNKRRPVRLYKHHARGYTHPQRPITVQAIARCG
jgi:hypothetical protein